MQHPSISGLIQPLNPPRHSYPNEYGAARYVNPDPKHISNRKLYFITRFGEV